MTGISNAALRQQLKLAEQQNEATARRVTNLEAWALAFSGASLYRRLRWVLLGR